VKTPLKARLPEATSMVAAGGVERCSPVNVGSGTGVFECASVKDQIAGGLAGSANAAGHAAIEQVRNTQRASA